MGGRSGSANRADHRVKRPLIIGGGLAGPAAAIRLAQVGQPPLLVERQAGAHDKICGEFLSGEAVEQLAALGVSTTQLGAMPIDRVVLASGHRRVEASLPFVAHSIRRRTLDAALLAHAARCGATVQQGIHARRITAGVVETDHGTLAEGAIVLATGKHAMPGMPRRWTSAERVVDDLVGFKMYLRATPATRRRLARTVEVVAYDGGYAGIQLVSPDVINLCLVISKTSLRTIGGEWTALATRLALESALTPYLDAEPQLPRPLTISGVPYGYLRRADLSDTVYCIGDQAAVIPSFCGDGMAIAIHSGVQVAAAVSGRVEPPRFHAELQQATSGPVGRAMRFQRILRTPWGRSALLLGFAGIPGMVRLLARATRITPPHRPAHDGLDGPMAFS